MKSLHKKFTLVGPGGLRCPCCAPQPGNKYARRAIQLIKKQARLREQRDLNQLIALEAA